MASEIKVDTISEKTSGNGVTIDSVSIKDNKVDINGTAGGLILDADADTHISANTDDVISIACSGTAQVTISDGAISPVTDNDIDLGTASLEFKNIYVDGTVRTDAIDFGTTTMELPTADGSANQVLKTDGSGNLDWVAQASFAVGDITGATALAVPPDGDDEIAFSDGGTLKRLDVKLMQNRPLFYAYHDAGFTISNGGAVKLAFNTEVIDTDGVYDHSSTIGRVTIPSGMDGIWLFGTKVTCPGVDSGEEARTELHINGNNTTNYYGTHKMVSYASNVTLTQNTVIVVEADAADYFEWYFFQNSGDSQDLATSKGNNCVFGWRIAGGEN